MRHINWFLLLLIVIVVLISFTSEWLFVVFKKEPIIAVVLFTLSIGLSFELARLGTKWLRGFCLVGLIVFSVLFTYTHLAKEIFKPSVLDINIIETRQSYYPYHLGKLIHNKYTLFFYKIQRNFLTNISFNQFFFGGEPRFRPYALDFEKYSLFYLIFFLYGLFCILRLQKKIIKFFLVYLFVILLILVFADPGFDLGLYPLYPIITAILSFGIYNLTINLNRIRK